MNKVFKSIITSLMFTSLTATTVLASNVQTVTNVTSVNNTSGKSTYVISKDEAKEIGSSFTTYSQLVNYKNGDSYKNVQGYSKQESWLYEHDVLSTDTLVSSDGVNLSYTKLDVPNVMKNKDEVDRPNFLMALCKSFYGVQKSRPIIFWTRSAKTQERVNDDLTYLYTEGNYWTYVSPNVYELYFTTLLDKGFISLDEFSNLEFRNDYQNLTGSNKPSWFNGLNSFQTKLSNGSPLGQSFSISTGMFSSSKHKSVDYFIDSSISKIDALKLIEEILRTEEADMTDLESKIINYKYGATYLLNLDEDVQKTLMYLIAKGILNFEDSEEFSNLYSNLTYKDFITIMYRVANKSARKDFSKVQLTDSDNYWLEQGMQEASLEMFNKINTGIDISVTEEPASEVSEDEDFIYDVDSEQFFSLSFLRRKNKYFAKEGYKDWKVTMDITNPGAYAYKGTELSKLKADDYDEISKIETKDSGARVVITFKVNSPTQFSAAAVIKNSFSMTDGSNVIGEVPAICKIEKDGKVNYYISKSKIDSISDEIVVMQDKYLINKSTNTSAVLLDKDNLALIGNEVVSMDKTSVSGVDGEVYYNLNVIARLMTNAYIDKFWSDAIFTESLYSSQGDSTLTSDFQKPVAMRSTGSGESFDYGLKSRFIGLKNETYSDYKKSHRSANFQTYAKDTSCTYESGNNYVSLLHSSKAMNVLYKKIKDSDDDKKDIYMMVIWVYALPSDSVFPNAGTQSYYTKSNPSVEEASSFLFTRPTDDNLQAVWDKNIGLSNALCNYIYETKDVEYFSSGYAVPKVYFFSRSKMTNDKINKKLKALPYDESYKATYASDSNLLDSLFESSNSTTARTCQFIQGFSKKDVIDYQGFALDKTGVFYASTGSKGIFENMTFAEKNSKNNQTNEDCFLIKTRPTMSEGKLTKGGDYDVMGHEATYRGTKEIDGEMYYKFQLNTPVICNATPTGSGKYAKKITVKGANLMDWYKKTFIDGYEDTVYYSKNAKYRVVAQKVLDLAKKTSSDGVYYLMPHSTKNSDSYDCYAITKINSKKTKMEMISGKDITRNNGTFGGTLNIVPLVYLKVNRWAVQDGGSSNISKMIQQETYAYLDRSNLTGVGIAANVIDSVILNSYKTVTCKKLPNKATVFIGDMKFTVRGGKLYSAPQTNAEAVSKIASFMYDGSNGKSINVTNLKSVLCSMFDGIGISYVDSNNGSLSGGQALVKHIASDDSGLPKLKISPCYFDVQDDSNVLTNVGGDYYVVNSGGKKTSFTSDNNSFNAFCFSVVFNSTIKFRPLDKKGTTYSIVYASTKYGNGKLSKVPFKTEDLDYNWQDDIYNRLGNTEFQPAKFASELMTKIKQAYLVEQKNSIKGLISTIIVYTLSYLVVMEFVVLACKKVGLIRYYLQKIYEPNSGSMQGIDLIKIFTLGFESYDTESNLVRTVGIAGILILILCVFIHIMY